MATFAAQTQFMPQVDRDGQLRLYCLAHDGLFVSDARSSQLASHVSGIPFCMVLENSNNAQFVLTPSFALHRPRVRSLPLSTHLIPHRSSEWANKVRTRVFVYPVHACGEFLQISSLSSALYVALRPSRSTAMCVCIRKLTGRFVAHCTCRYLCMLRLMSRDYTKAARLISMCEVDVPLSHEQQFLVSLINRTATDSHPDAHACRLRLALVCLGAGDFHVAWDVVEDYSQYLKKLGAVSMACRLTDDEEQKLLARFLDGSPEVEKHPGVTELSMRKLFFKAGGSFCSGALRWWVH